MSTVALGGCRARKQASAGVPFLEVAEGRFSPPKLFHCNTLQCVAQSLYFLIRDVSCPARSLLPAPAFRLLRLPSRRRASEEEMNYALTQNRPERPHRYG